MSDDRHFTPKLFEFLRDLDANNDRAWFKANQDRYEQHVKEPALRFINDFAGRLRKISPHFVADSRPVGGSLFRIHRDTRFSKDKTPYKTNTGVHFRHERAKDAHAPGYYLHVDPAGSFGGVGIWHPETKVQYQIREAIAADPARWKRVTRSKKFTGVFGSVDGERLKRPPKGFDPDDALIEDIKLKSFVASTRFSQKQVTAPGFIDEFAATCTAGTPFVKFLCEALGVAF